MSNSATTRIVWIGHPVSGNIEANLAKITAICEHVQREEGVQPLFPSFTSRRYATPLTTEESERQVRAFLGSLAVSELWLYGNGITDGMQREVRIARQLGVRVVPKTTETEEALRGLGI